MRQTQLFTRTIKELPKDETSYNAQTLIRAGFIDKLAAGVYSFLPLGWRVMNKIREIIREEMFEIDGQEINMPALAPKENWEASGRYESLDILFKTIGSDEREYVLNPTHEEVVTPLASKFIFSYRELPFAVFQIQTKFRNEKRAKAGLLRGREFLMKDLYSFHVDQADLDAYYDRAIQAYKNIFARLGLGDKTYLTYASGGSFSKYSHEFQTLTEAGEDLIYACPHCKVAVNKEIIDEQNTCPECGEKKLIEKKAVEVGNIFKLVTKFSEAFNLQYQTAEGSKKPVIMGCYGIGLSRILGTIVEACHDEKGIIWPETVAPFKVHLLSLNENEEADKIYEALKNAGIEVLYDDRDLAAGEKFVDADLIGCPYRLVISKKTLAQQSGEIKNRQTGQEEMVKISELVDKFRA
ncbi:MAG: proline--tRNA ligase [Patescibacteria group bacterium]|jgi:prolyl-tRNA synthetase|nr:His/Gly/Thr/Pro-type tRNA ligase C-terminal domain-containing protein [bacterium]HQC49736.1 His/Gly/Thr/Pro-type tRNA ligase C-terminal domain-containing protein [bacterium]